MKPDMAIAVDLDFFLSSAGRREFAEGDLRRAAPTGRTSRGPPTSGEQGLACLLGGDQMGDRALAKPGSQKMPTPSVFLDPGQEMVGGSVKPGFGP